ncbi:hypothetical protein [Ornithinimicrobium sufpigmenti]|uniref:hypothetical protein n=1 Tax=Ornithinimicrobium sufpigmenti TaxID=2508882 RepID=UPI001035B41E|nr:MULTISPECIES: hypothetical protein [unclassified Ornithinimicrobium]
MDVVSRARTARVRALVVPVVMSVGLWVVAGSLALSVVAWPVLLVPVGLAAVVWVAGVGERWVAASVLLARKPRLHQRHTLAPVAQVLLDCRAGVPGLVLLVGHGGHVGVSAVGSRTVVVTRGLVDAVASGRLGPVTAAALVGHELGVVRAGLTRRQVALTVFLAPWSVWLVVVLGLWEAAATILPRRLMVACLVINGGVGLWLGVTVHPAHHAGVLFVSLVLWAWWAFTSWGRARTDVGDAYLVQVGLAAAYADWLIANCGDDHSRDRAVTLKHPHVEGNSPTGPVAPSRDVRTPVAR